jgi:[histone H3]-lysine36 N-dimethyltransferase SETMAR
MDSKTYIRACALFMFDQGKSTKETTQVISDLYPADAVTERNCARWFAKFRAGDRSLQDLPRSGRPQILDRQSLKAAVDADSSVTSRELAIEFGCCQKTIINGLHEIGKVCKRGRWIPFKLTENHKVQRMVTCQSMLSMAKKANFFDSILTGDEKWITFDNTHRGLQWLGPDQVPEGTPKPHKFVKKVMLCVWWNTKGIVHHEVLESGQTVKSDLYCLQLERVNQGLVRKDIDPTKTRLLHDNARPHVSVKTQQKIEELGWKCYHMRHTALTWPHLIIICLGQWSTRFAICSSPTFMMSENGSVTFLPPSQPRSTIQGSETYEKDARAQ